MNNWIEQTPGQVRALVGGVCHDINNLLFPARVFTSEFRQRPPGDGSPEQRTESEERWAALEQVWDRAALLTQKLLGYVGYDARPLQLDLRYLVRDAIRAVRGVGALVETTEEPRLRAPEQALWINAPPAAMLIVVCDVLWRAQQLKPTQDAEIDIELGDATDALDIRAVDMTVTVQPAPKLNRFRAVLEQPCAISGLDDWTDCAEAVNTFRGELGPRLPLGDEAPSALKMRLRAAATVTTPNPPEASNDEGVSG